MRNGSKQVYNSACKPIIVALILVVCACGCSETVDSQAKHQIRIGVSSSYPSWLDKLVEIFKSKLNTVVFSTKEIAGSVVSVDLLESEEVDVTITGSHIAYAAFNNGTDAIPTPHRKIRGMAVVTVSAMHLVVAPGSDIKTVQDVKGRRIGIGAVGSSTEFTVRRLLPEFGVLLSEVDASRLPFEQMPPKLADRSLEAEFVQVSAPSPFAKAALGVKGTRLIPIKGPAISTLRQKYPFFRPVVIPAGTYGHNEDTETVGVDFMLVCHVDVPDDLIYGMLKILFEALPELAQQHPELGVITFQQSPGVSIPLHPGAAAFYRERDLFR